MKMKRRSVLWKALLALYALILLAVLELNQHTLPGWALAFAAVIVFAVLRAGRLRECGAGVRLAAWAALIAVSALILWLSWPPVRAVPAVSGKDPQKTRIVHTAQGDLTGVCTEDGAVEVFAGIPYAKPPVGELRWREPQPAEGWNGVLQADHFAPMSMQTTNLPLVDSLTRIIGFHDYKISLTDQYRTPVSEDSLYLNIWRPAGEPRELPVLVYIHGGSLQTGQPWYADYGGESLARNGVIVVNMGYRLGIFGFYADAALAAESPNGTTGNYGLLDQICALQWVQDHIADFGGDPGNVTIAGESAGSACVTALCTSPLAKGLFRRVIAESSTVTAKNPAHSFRSMEEALRTGAETRERLGASTPEALRGLSAKAIAGELAAHHHLTVDGYALTETPYASYQRGSFNEEARLHGFNQKESAPFILFDHAKMNNYAGKIRALLGDEQGGRFLEAYPVQTDAQAEKYWEDLYSAYFFTYGHYCWERQANGIPTYEYLFSKSNGRLGTWHSGEEVYFYGNIPADSGLYDEEDRALSRQMVGYFVNFIKTGDPNGEDLPPWPANTGAEGKLLHLDRQIAMGEDPFLPYYPYIEAQQKES